MNHIRALIVSFLLIGILFSSCDLINPPETIPSYIRVDTFKVEVSDFDQGSSSHYITVCYISVGGDNLGVFEMPFTVPSLETGLKTITIRPGIKLNGIAASRIDYPFFEPYIIDLELHREEIHIIEPITTYKESCVFPWMENFEDPGISFTHAEYSDTIFVNQNELVKEGRYSGAIFLDHDMEIFEAVSSGKYELPKDGGPAILEFDYKNNNGFEVGMYLLEEGLSEWYGLVYINPSTRWKRFYVDVGLTARTKPSTEFFKMGIRAFPEPQNNDATEIYLDNIKLIHF